MQLSGKVAELQKRLSSIRATDKGGWTDDNFGEIVRLLQPINISTDLADGSGKSARKDIPLLTLLVIFRDRLVTGIANPYGMSEQDKLLFFNVCPKLEIHGLATSEKFSSAGLRRKFLTPKGHAFLTFLDRKMIVETPSASKEIKTAKEQEAKGKAIKKHPKKKK